MTFSILTHWQFIKLQIVQQWQRWTKRERVFVGVLITVSAALIIYFFLFQPVHHQLLKARENLAYNLETAKQIQGLYPRWQQLHKQQKRPPRIEANRLLSHIDRSLHTFQLSSFNPQLQQIGHSKVRITLDRTDFDALIHWLSSLWQQFNIKVDELSITARGNPGIVDTVIVLSL